MFDHFSTLCNKGLIWLFFREVLSLTLFLILLIPLVLLLTLMLLLVILVIYIIFIMKIIISNFALLILVESGSACSFEFIFKR